MCSWNFYLKRRKIRNIEKWLSEAGIKTYSDFCAVLNRLGVVPPEKNDPTVDAYFNPPPLIPPEATKENPIEEIIVQVEQETAKTAPVRSKRRKKKVGGNIDG